MRFAPCEIHGVMIVETEPHCDERGFFARLYCPEEFRLAGLDFAPVQINLSRNMACGVLRGLHWQDPPMAEAKLVRASQGRLFDVVVDIRPESPTFRRWVGVELDAGSGRALYIPEGCAHGFLTLEPGTDVQYLMGRMHQPGFERGARWDDSAFAIVWPASPSVVSAKDQSWPPFQRPAHPPG